MRLLLLLAAAIGIGACGCRPASPPAGIAPYVEFLERGHGHPVDYLLGLFDEHDLVIVCERAHPEATQYELFWSLVSDPRFQARAGHVFTELGGRNLQGELDRLFDTPGLSAERVSERLLPIYRELTFHPLWVNQNFFDFLRRLYLLDDTLPEDRRVRAHFSDVAYSWQAMTPEARRAFEETLGERDLRIAERIIERFRALEASGQQRAKALVILNYRHAYNDFTFDDGARGANVGRYLFEAFPGRVANVLLNTLALRLGGTDSAPILVPIQDGTWDAAFRFSGDRPAGFDLAGSPFGADRFDHFPARTDTVRYEQVFDGFVFWHPVREQRYLLGVPGLVDRAFLAELERRYGVLGLEPSDQEIREWLARSQKPESAPVDGAAEVEAAIERWLAGLASPGGSVTVEEDSR